MTRLKSFKIRYYREMPGDMGIADIALPALAMRDIIRAVILQLKSYRGDEATPQCADILDEAGELLERIVLTPAGARLATPPRPSETGPA